MTVTLTKITDTCTSCGADCAPSPSIEVDSLCTACIADFRARDINLDLPTLHDFAMTLTEPAMTMPTNDPYGMRDCFGWGEDCGNPIGPAVDLCNDCHNARLDAESPRIPR